MVIFDTYDHHRSTTIYVLDDSGHSAKCCISMRRRTGDLQGKKEDCMHVP
jgi:hypothetical protein